MKRVRFVTWPTCGSKPSPSTQSKMMMMASWVVKYVRRMPLSPYGQAVQTKLDKHKTSASVLSQLAGCVILLVVEAPRFVASE
uniref:Uncharacterized protein n=1 Tax=Timema bartmani TaxID=61472 RepID=A0A7R9ENB9_9NEOP|nr:unnamed protein product [Timema bartmani]